jgi:flagellum-specific peptidoglycan hydrolase FlgJ
MDEQRQAFNAFLTAARGARANGFPINPVAAAAQACLETGFGKSTPPGSSNVLGIKAGRSWKGPVVAADTREFYAGVPTNVRGVLWRVYQNIQECFEDYGRIIRDLWWYQDAEEQADGDPFDYLTALKPIYGPDGIEVLEPGYFTDPEYVVKTMKIVRQHHAPAANGSPSDRLLVVRVDGVQQVFEIPEGYDIVQRVSFDRRRHWVDVRPSGS